MNGSDELAPVRDQRMLLPTRGYAACDCVLEERCFVPSPRRTQLQSALWPIRRDEPVHRLESSFQHARESVLAALRGKEAFLGELVWWRDDQAGPRRAVLVSFLRCLALLRDLGAQHRKSVRNIMTIEEPSAKMHPGVGSKEKVE